MKPFWYTKDEPPYIGMIRRKETTVNWGLILSTVVMILFVLLLGIGLYANELVQFFKDL